MTTATPYISADEVFARVSFGQAVHAVQAAFDAGLDPATDFERSVLDVQHGQLLLMPSTSPRFVGVKVATVAPGNPARGRERIQGVYLLMDAETLGLVATIDGTALTTLRTRRSPRRPPTTWRPSGSTTWSCSVLDRRPGDTSRLWRASGRWAG